MYLNLFTIKFPITAIVSILHRASGALMFLFIPLFLSLLQTIILIPEHFDLYFAQYCNKYILLAVLIVLVYHLFAGIRHMSMDVGFVESRSAARITSYLVFLLTLLVSILLGYSLC